MAVVLAILGVTLLLVGRPKGIQSVRTVDYAGTVTSAQRVADYHLVAPKGLPSQWRATSAYVDQPGGDQPLALHVGFVTPAGRYAALEETKAPAPAFVQQQVNGAPPAGTVVVDGRSWQTYRAAAGEESLATTYDTAAVVLTGGAGLDELKTLAAALR